MKSAIGPMFRGFAFGSAATSLSRNDWAAAPASAVAATSCSPSDAETIASSCAA